jgi:hypothetical protein
METYVPPKYVLNSSGIPCVTSYGHRCYNLKSKKVFLDQQNNHDKSLFRRNTNHDVT